MYIAILLVFSEWCEDFKWIHDRCAGHCGDSCAPSKRWQNITVGAVGITWKLTGRGYEMPLLFEKMFAIRWPLQDLETHVPTSKERSQILKVSFRCGDLKTEAQRSCLHPQGRESRIQSPIRCRGTRPRHSVDTISSVSNQNFTGDGEELTQVYRNRRRSQKLFIRAI